MAFLGGLKSFLGTISLKRKPGGTAVGNFLRTAVSNATGGLLGNGAMMLQEGETKEAANERMLNGAGAAVSAFATTAGAGVVRPDSPLPSYLQGVQSGVVLDQIKQYLPWVFGGLLTLVVTKSLLAKK